MLSEFFPAWVLYVFASTTSPVVTLLTRWTPRPFKAIVLFACALVTTGYVVFTTQLELSQLIEQSVMLFGLIAGGYTAASINPGKMPRISTVGVGVGAFLLLGLGLAAASIAQAPAGADSVLTTSPSPTMPIGIVQYLTLGWLAWGAGYIARAIKKYIWF